MEDATHLLQYRRFFGLLFSVLPGLELMYGLTFLVIWIFADLIQIPWGWGVGLGALTFALTLTVWLFVGMGIQKWAEEKTGMFLFALNVPFLLVFFGVMSWLFVEVVVLSEGPGGHSAMILSDLRAAFA